MAPSKNNVKAIFIDLDGTLLDSNLNITEETSSIIVHSISQGHRIVFASGRPIQSILNICEKCGITGGYVIASNGAITWDISENKAVNVQHLQKGMVDILCKLASAHQVNVALYCIDSWYVMHDDQYSTLEEKRSGTVHSGLIRNCDKYDEFVKIMYIGDNATLLLVSDAITALGLPVKPFFSYPEYLELLVEGVTKQEAAAEVLKRFGLSWSDAIAIGDGANDIDLMRAAHIRVAMGNALPAVKAIANVIAPDNDSEGVAIALKALLFGEAASNKQLSLLMNEL